MQTEFGIVMQHGYVVSKIEEVVPKWAALGIGPFFTGPSFKFDKYVYRGEELPCSLRCAIGYWGNIQIELLEPIGDSKSLYADEVRRAPGKLNHFATIVPDVDALIAKHDLAGKVVQHGLTRGIRFAYIEGIVPGDVLLELFESTELTELSSAVIHAAARDWNGSRPLRGPDELAEGMGLLAKR
jgi:methylmalonyl-CoA/ethylmalonyl-CoA epimerase